MRRATVFLLFSVFCIALGLFGQSAPVYFVQLSDPQFGMYSGNKGFEQESANYEFAVASVNRLKPAFVVVTGDLVNNPGDAAQIAEYRRISAKIDPSIPLYNVPGNHDVGNEPTPETLAAWRERFGRDFCSFRAGPLYGIVLNSALIYAPGKAMEDFERQEQWLKAELAKASASGAPHVVVFQHHPFFTKDAGEKDEYHNIPLERRRRYLDLLAGSGVKYVFAGHYHQNAVARDGAIEVVTTGPVGSPLGRGDSGIRIVRVSDAAIEHRYYGFGDLPATLESVKFGAAAQGR